MPGYDATVYGKVQQTLLPGSAPADTDSSKADTTDAALVPELPELPSFARKISDLTDLDEPAEEQSQKRGEPNCLNASTPVPATRRISPLARRLRAQGSSLTIEGLGSRRPGFAYSPPPRVGHSVTIGVNTKASPKGLSSTVHASQSVAVPPTRPLNPALSSLSGCSSVVCPATVWHSAVLPHRRRAVAAAGMLGTSVREQSAGAALSVAPRVIGASARERPAGATSSVCQLVQRSMPGDRRPQAQPVLVSRSSRLDANAQVHPLPFNMSGSIRSVPGLRANSPSPITSSRSAVYLFGCCSSDALGRQPMGGLNTVLSRSTTVLSSCARVPPAGSTTATPATPQPWGGSAVLLTTPRGCSTSVAIKPVGQQNRGCSKPTVPLGITAQSSSSASPLPGKPGFCQRSLGNSVSVLGGCSRISSRPQNGRGTFREARCPPWCNLANPGATVRM